jgi:hypothetical protein
MIMIGQKIIDHDQIQDLHNIINIKKIQNIRIFRIIISINRKILTHNNNNNKSINNFINKNINIQAINKINKNIILPKRIKLQRKFKMKLCLKRNMMNLSGKMKNKK